MAVIRIPDDIWEEVEEHFSQQPGEHFAFFLADWTISLGEPVLMVKDAICIPDSEVTGGVAEMEVSLEALIGAVNTAIRADRCLIETHNHTGRTPRFSTTDRANLPEFVEYVHASLENRPYAATVWGEGRLYGEYFLPSGEYGVIDRVTITGDRVRQVVSRDYEDMVSHRALSRQLPWFSASGQEELARLRVAIVGCGGIGSLVVQNLAYLGCRDFLVIDDDQVEESNLNRLVTATREDIGASKAILARRLIKNIAPDAEIREFNRNLREPKVLDALRGADLLLGCVDNDGARLLLNEIGLAYGIPLIDIAVGLEVQSGQLALAGGRVAIVKSEGPCLHCMQQIDVHEANHFLLPPKAREENINRGYVTGADVAAPSVISLNAQLAASAVNEFAMFFSGSRPPNPYIEVDLLGVGRVVKGQYASPVVFERNSSCISCTVAGLGDESGIIERYGLD